VYTAFHLFLERRDALTERHRELIGVEAETADLLALPAAPVRAQWVVPFASLPAYEEITARFPELELNTAMQLDMPGIAFSSVTRRGTSKLSAAEWLAARHGLTLGEAAMVGDGDGDLELVRHAGLGIAMGNATEGVKAAARRVVADVDAGAWPRRSGRRSRPEAALVSSPACASTSKTSPGTLARRSPSGAG
jgi:hydroxymethylpyrimidine pyrophosphatase-like HAD family hydrolase